MANWTQHTSDVNQLHRDVFGFSDNIGPSSGLAMPPRPPSSRPPPTTRPPPPRRPVNGRQARGPAAAPATGGLASAKRLVFSRPGPTGGHALSGARAGRPGAAAAASLHPWRGAAGRHTRRGSGSTRGPNSITSSSSFVSSPEASAAHSDASVHDDDDDGDDGDDTTTEGSARFASTNRYYVAASALGHSDDDEMGQPPLVPRTAERRQPSAPVETKWGDEAATCRSPAEAPAPHAPHKPAAPLPAQHAPSPWQTATPDRTGAETTTQTIGGPVAGGSPAHRPTRTGSAHGHGVRVSRTLLDWAEAAGIRTQPPAAYAALSAQAAEDVRRCAAPWRQLCAKGSDVMRVHGEHVASLRDRRRRSVGTSGRNSLLGLSADGSPAARRRFADPNHSRLGTASKNGSVTNLRAFRQRQSHGRWCQWQLNHFFEGGPAYLGSVWRHRECGTIMQIPDLLDGRYVVPTGRVISEGIRALNQRDRRERVFRQLLLREQGLAAAGDDGDLGGPHTDADAHGADRDTDVSGAKSPDPRSEDEDKDDGGKTSYADVRFDTDTGLLMVSLYVDAPDSDETGTFLHAFVAGCLDGFRWLILTGPWRQQVMFFQPRYDRAVPLLAEPQDVSRASVPTAAGRARSSQLARRVSGFHSFCVHGVVFLHEDGDSDSSANGGPQDPFVCTRCGNIRAYNPVYVSRTGALARGRYRCWVCRRHTNHLRAPPSYLLALRLVKARLAQSDTTSATAADTPRGGSRHQPVSDSVVDPYKRLPQPPLAPRTTVSATLRFLSARDQTGQRGMARGRQQPRWDGSGHVNHDLLLGRPRPLSVAPPKPTI